jgi:hypothetical protein
MIIDGIEYKPAHSPDRNIRIVVLQRGWVVVGFYERDGDNVTLSNASIIRTWGTTNGLGEIAKAGPTSKTILDPSNGDIQFHRLTEILTLNCNEEKWMKYC